jgi:hypothetical protein
LPRLSDFKTVARIWIFLNSLKEAFQHPASAEVWESLNQLD